MFVFKLQQTTSFGSVFGHCVNGTLTKEILVNLFKLTINHGLDNFRLCPLR